IHDVQLAIGSIKTNPSACIVTTLPLITEQEPNDTASQGNRITIPCGVNGRIGTKRDLDYFAFKGTKGKAIRFEIFARRYGTSLTSRLDSMIDILNSQGAIVASSDDVTGKDSSLVFTPSADGEFLVRVRDLNNKGGDGYGYFLEADWARPDFTIRCDPSKAMIGPGGRSAWFIQIVRTNGFVGPVKVEMKGLPPEVTVNPLTIPASMTQGLLVVSASRDATTPKGFNVEIVGTGESTWEGKSETLIRPVIAVEEIYSPGGGRAKFDVRMQTVAVTGPNDILAINVKPEKLVLKPGEEVKIDVDVVRNKDYDKAVNIDIPLRHLGTVFGNSLPPGVTMVDGKSKTLLGSGTKGHITLKVDATAAPIEDVPISVMASVSINFVVKVSYSSAPILISIRK
ncbi:MAG: PPC domain-containing protein, partial [Planctomycetes bacterium]|nr:PPC domain-containing protein [Planctomycetota bacterium]